MNAVVFASGSGTNFEALMEAQKEGKLDVDIQALFCDRPEAYALKRAENWNIPSKCIELKNCENKADYEKQIIRWISQFSPEMIILSGYMKIVSKTLLNVFDGRIVNLHPALLPEFPGAHAIQDAYEAGVPVTGVTVHFIDEGVDTGPVIVQKAVPVPQGCSLDELEAAVHAAEYATFYQGINKARQILDQKNH